MKLKKNLIKKINLDKFFYLKFKGSIFGKIRENFSVIGKIIKWTEKVRLFGLMEEVTIEITRTIKSMGKVYSLGNNDKYFNILIKIFRADGRKYNGMWKIGKQHGEGYFYNVETKTWQRGIWDEGKRVRWIQSE